MKRTTEDKGASVMCNVAKPFPEQEAVRRDGVDAWRQRFCLDTRWLAMCVFLLAISPAARGQVSFQGVTAVIDTGSAVLNGPLGAAIDAAGNVYISNSGTGQIVKIDAQGATSVLALNAYAPTPGGLHGLAANSNGNLYIADRLNKRILEVSPSGNASPINLGQVTLAGPEGIAVDGAGNLFIADSAGNKIVEAPAAGTPLVLNISGLDAPLSSPSGVAVDSAGNLYVADEGNNRIVKVAVGTFEGSTLNISGIRKSLAKPEAVAVDPSGKLYIADTGNSRVIEVGPAGNASVVSTNALTLGTPSAVAADPAGTIYITDLQDNQLLKIAPSAVGFGHVTFGAAAPVTETLPFTVAEGITLGSAAALTLGGPNLDFTVANGSTCTAGTTGATCTVNVQFSPAAPGLRRGAVVLYDTSSNPLLSVPIYGFADAAAPVLLPEKASVMSIGGAALNQPMQVAMDGLGNMYVANFGANNVLEVSPGGDAVVTSTGQFTLNGPSGTAVDGAGNLFISDRGNERVLVVTPSGAASALTINGVNLSLGAPAELNFDAAGNLYIADILNSRVIRVSSLAVTEAGASGIATLLQAGDLTRDTGGITGVAIDDAGAVYIADASKNRVVRSASMGGASLLNTAGIELNTPYGLATGAAGNLYIADTGNNRIVALTAEGTLAVGSQNLPASSSLAGPYDVAADAFGNLLISDTGNNRIAKVPVAAVSGVRQKSSALTPTIVWSPPGGVTYGTNLSGVLNATAVSGGVPVLGTFTYTATPAGGTAGTITAATVLAVDTYTLTATFTPNDTTDYTTATASVPFTVTRGVAAVTVVSSQNPVLLNNPVTFTATVSAAAGTPTGTVLFVNGTMQVASETLTGGVATFTTSALSAGAHSITAIYSGDANFDSADSAVLTQTVEDFSFNFAPTNSITPLTLFPGSTAYYTLQISPTLGPNFPSAVNFSASGLPPGAKATFTPASLAAGAAATNVQLQIQLANQINSQLPAVPLGPKLALAMLGGIWVAPFALRRRRRARRVRLAAMALLLLAIACAALGLTACGGSGTGYFGQQPVNYTITVAATSGALSHSATVTLTVQ